MQEQNYEHHSRFYTPHHFVFYPIILVMCVVCAYGLLNYEGQELLWIMMLAMSLLVCFLSLMLRQHYALMNQNRLVRLEMRFRYYVLTRQRFEKLEAQLSRSQIYALRFASDEELPALTDRALKERLSPDAIKRAIRNWQADDMRV